MAGGAQFRGASSGALARLREGSVPGEDRRRDTRRPARARRIYVLSLSCFLLSTCTFLSLFAARFPCSGLFTINNQAAGQFLSSLSLSPLRGVLTNAQTFQAESMDCNLSKLELQPDQMQVTETRLINTLRVYDHQ